LGRRLGWGQLLEILTEYLNHLTFEIAAAREKHYLAKRDLFWPPLDNPINLVNTAMGNEAEAILDALKAGRFLLSVHAARRMSQRSVTKADIQACGRTARSCLYQAEHGTYRIEGEDLDGEPLTVICALAAIVVIVTLF
jgi:hypothetical protein